MQVARFVQVQNGGTAEEESGLNFVLGSASCRIKANHSSKMLLVYAVLSYAVCVVFMQRSGCC